MTIGTRAVTALAAAAGALVLVSCGGDDAGAPRLTLTETDCSFDGDATIAATETFETQVVNESSKLGAFEIARIDEGHTFEEVQAYVESERQRIADGLVVAGTPTYMTLGARAQVESNTSGTLVSTVSAGTWVLWCAQEHPPTGLFLINPPLDVS